MSQQVIHETAIVKSGAKIADDVTIGPYCIVGSDVTIGEGSILMSHVSLIGNTVIGKNNKIYQGAVIGTWPQDISFTGEDTRVEIGNDNVIREYVTIHRGTHKDRGVTSIGDNNYIMAYAHIAHDCEMGNSVILSNGVQLAGHVKVEDRVNVGGLAAFHHYVTVGRLAFVGGMTRIVRDVPPFMTVEGNPSKVRCVNVVGCSRSGMDSEAISDLREAYRMLYRQKLPVGDAVVELEKIKSRQEIQELISFLRKSALGKQGRAREVLRK